MTKTVASYPTPVTLTGSIPAAVRAQNPPSRQPRRGTPRAWLLVIARTTALDWFRADARRRRREERADTAERHRTEEDGFGEGFSPALEEGLRALTAGEREVVALRIVLDLDGEETARLLGITPTAVSTRLSRALAKLEERMRDHDVA